MMQQDEEAELQNSNIALRLSMFGNRCFCCMIFCLEFADFGLNARNWLLILCFCFQDFHCAVGKQNC